ncbi:hypothetical protein MJI20_29825, partial [Salmonella enterica subsp. enterica serovar Anatum]|nr:hypothetical protein [Salmonella enterica subsp. enterica serovar Anatum]
QEEIRRDLQNEGFEGISQSTVSRLLKLLGAIKIRNTKGQKIYSIAGRVSVLTSYFTANKAHKPNFPLKSISYQGDAISIVHTLY